MSALIEANRFSCLLERTLILRFYIGMEIRTRDYGLKNVAQQDYYGLLYHNLLRESFYLFATILLQLLEILLSLLLMLLLLYLLLAPYCLYYLHLLLITCPQQTLIQILNVTHTKYSHSQHYDCDRKLNRLQILSRSNSFKNKTYIIIISCLLPSIKGTGTATSHETSLET